MLDLIIVIFFVKVTYVTFVGAQLGGKICSTRKSKFQCEESKEALHFHQS